MQFFTHQKGYKSCCIRTVLHLICISLFLVFVSLPLAGQEISAQASVDTTDILIGDHLELELNIATEDEVSIFWPMWLDSLGRMEIISTTEIDSTVEGDKRIKSQVIYLTAFDSGAYQIPPVNFYYSSTYSNDTLSVSTEPLDIFVHTVKVDTAQAIKPIKSIESIPLTFGEVLPWIIIAMLVLGIIAGVWYWNYLRKKRKAIPIEEKVPDIPPHELALEQLQTLEQKKLWQEGKVKVYYIELTDILRTYLEGRYAIPALESTTEEILEDIRKKDIQDSLRNQLKALLERADLTKFAKLRPGPEENRTGLDIVRQFVQSTKQIILEDESAKIVEQPTQTS